MHAVVEWLWGNRLEKTEMANCINGNASRKECLTWPTLDACVHVFRYARFVITCSARLGTSPDLISRLPDRLHIEARL